MRLVGFLLALLLCSHVAHAGDAEDLFDEPVVDRAMSVAVAARFGPLLGNPYNDDVGLGGTFGFWPTRWFGVEVTGQAFPLSADANTRPLAVAVLRLLDPSERIESLDPKGTISFGPVFSPIRGWIAPPGAPGIHAEVLVGVGVAVSFHSVEMLYYSADGAGTEQASLALAPQDLALAGPQVHLGGRLGFTPWLGFRWDMRLLGWIDQVLNYDEDTAAATNRNLGPLANRLSCEDRTLDAACKTAAGGALSVEFAIELTFGPGTIGGGQ